MIESRTSFKEYPGDWIGEQADEICNQINQIKEQDKKPTSTLTRQQVNNIIGHMLLASEYLETLGINGETHRGSFELVDSVGLIVGKKAPEFKENFSNLSEMMRKYACGAQYRVRRSLQVPLLPHNEKVDPECMEIYLKLAEHAYLRDHRLHKPTSKPDQDLPEELNEEVANWLINSPANLD